MKLLRNLALLPALLFAALASQPALAQATGPDLSSLTSAISVDTVITAILAVGAVMVGLALAVLGVRKVLRMIKA